MFPFIPLLAADPAPSPGFVAQALAWLALAETRLGLGIALGALGLWLMLPGGPGNVSIFRPFSRVAGDEPEAGNRGLAGGAASFLHQLTTLYGVGGMLSLASLGLLLSLLPAPLREHVPVLFWLLAGLTLGAAVATITMHSPVYCAIWFAVTLLGVSGIFFLERAQFLAVATVVVYAGAILVTFLLVLMLAQPDGHMAYDRLTWGWAPAALATFAGITLAALAIFRLSDYGALPVVPVSDSGVTSHEHVANLGAELLTKYLIPLEVAGVLLLVALVGAVAIAIQGKDPEIMREGAADA